MRPQHRLVILGSPSSCRAVPSPRNCACSPPCRQKRLVTKSDFLDGKSRPFACSRSLQRPPVDAQGCLRIEPKLIARQCQLLLGSVRNPQTSASGRQCKCIGGRASRPGAPRCRANTYRRVGERDRIHHPYFNCIPGARLQSRRVNGQCPGPASLVSRPSRYPTIPTLGSGITESMTRFIYV